MTEINRIHPALAALRVPIDSLKLDPKNERAHPKENLELIRRSYTEHGQLRPLIARAETRQLEAGHGQLRVAKELGWTEVAVLFTDHDPVQAKRFAIQDNQAGALAEWDFANLSETMKWLHESRSDVASLGFSDVETELFLATRFEPPPIDPGFQPDAPQDDGNAVQGGQRVVTFTASQWARLAPVLAAYRTRAGVNEKVRDAEVIERMLTEEED